MKEYLTVKEVARKFEVSPLTIYRMLEKKEIPAVKISDSWRFSVKEINDWLKQKRTKDNENH